MVGWLEGRAVRMFLGSYRGDGRTRYYIARRSRPMLIHRYVVRPQPPTSLKEKLYASLTIAVSKLMHRCELLVKLLSTLAVKELRNLLAKRGCVGRRPPRYLPDWVKKLDVPL